MAQPNDSGDKNEKPTPKKLRDARREGDVPKSRDLSQTLTTLAWLGLMLAAGGVVAGRLSVLFEQSWRSVGTLSPAVLIELAWHTADALLWLVIVPLTFVSVVGVLAEFLQVGPLLAFRKIAAKPSHLNPVAGAKRLFSRDNVVDALKALIKTALLIALTVFLSLRYVDDALALMQSPVVRFAELTRHLVVTLIAWVGGAFAVVAMVDWFMQKHRHSKKLRMSQYDIRQEYKQTEGDPQLKGQRQQLRREWSTQDEEAAARSAAAVVVNPTHIAVALAYDEDDCPVPMVSAKAEGHKARRMREAARAAGVPIVRHIPLARELNFRVPNDDVVPEDLFDAIAEVLVWARDARENAEGDGRFRDATRDIVLPPRRGRVSPVL